MITAFRRYLDTWIVRGFFLVMVGAFVLWGVGDVWRSLGASTWVAQVNGEAIEGATFQAEFQRAMAQAIQGQPPGQEPGPDLRRRVGAETLQRVISQTALSQNLREMGIQTPDSALRDAVLAMPAFRGPDGRFNRQTFEAVLRNNGLTEPRFLDLMRADLSQRQLLGAISAGATASETEIRPIFALQFEKRSAQTAEFAIAAMPPPPAPDEAALRRWYDNHPESYATPEFRHVKAIVLSAQTLARDIPITDSDLQAAYDQRKADYVTPEKRSVQVITAPDEAKAQALAAQWRDGADWTAIQKDAQAAGASAVQLDDATEALFPDPDLGRAVFAASPDTVSAPIKGALGWFVARLTNIAPGNTRSFDQVKEALRASLLAEKAGGLVYDRANKVDTLLANGTPFDELPGDLGLAGVSGTLDASGDTEDGAPAPIPGPPELRSALVKAAFQAQKGEPPHLVEVSVPAGGSAYYALSVDEIVPSGTRPFEEVKEKVEGDWTADQQRREAEKAATAMLVAIQGGQSFADAATVAGVAVHATPLMTRSQGAEGVPPELQRVLFGLKKGEPTMVEVPEGYLVAEPAEVIEPDPKTDQANYDRVRQVVKQSIADDLAALYVESLRNSAKVRIDDKNFDSIVQP